MVKRQLSEPIGTEMVEENRTVQIIKHACIYPVDNYRNWGKSYLLNPKVNYSINFKCNVRCITRSINSFLKKCFEVTTYIYYCSIVDGKPKRYRQSFNRIVSRKRLAWAWPRAVAEHVHGGAKTKVKGMLREKDELTVSVSWEVRECQLRSQRVWIEESGR